MRTRLPARPLLLPLLALLAAGSASAAPEALALRLTGFEPGQIRVARIVVDRPIRARVAGVGAGSRGDLYAYGWIVDDRTLAPVWTMYDAEPNAESEGSRNLGYDTGVNLAAGSYGVYYYAAASPFQVAGVFKGIFEKRVEDPSAWHIALWVREADADAVRIGAAEAEDPRDELRLAPLGDHAFVHRRFRIAAPTEVALSAVVEMDPRGGALADRSWLVELATRRVVWAAETGDRQPAGGAYKNRIVRGTVRLEPGGYELFAATDDSHSSEKWNALPPYVPDAWGVTLTAPAGALLRDGLPEERTIVRLTGARDDEQLAAVFRLDRRTDVRVYGLGEWSSGQGFLADHGWIEDAVTRATIWKMGYPESRPAGGASKNRAVDLVVPLPPGTYRVSYRTDDSHSAERWNSTPPDDARSWGVTLSTLDPEARFELLDLTAERVRK